MDVAAGDVHSVALRVDGTIWTWGDNSRSQLGNGPGPNQTNLIQVGTNRDWVSIGCPQGSTTFGVRKDGSLWVWGQSSTFTSGAFPFPTKVGLETNWLSVSPIGEARNGRNELWRVFDSAPSTNTSGAIACQLFLTNWVPNQCALACPGRLKYYQIRSNGTLWAESLTYSRSPARFVPSNRWLQVGRRSDWVSIRSSGGTAIGITADGTIWTWGLDLSQEPIMDLRSDLKRLQNQLMRALGFHARVA